MPSILPFHPSHCFQVRELVNAHLGAVIPGWALPDAAILDRLSSDPGEYIVDPWVTERVTLCALDRQRVVAIAHILRFGDGPEVSAYYKGAAELGWFLFWPDGADAASAILEAVINQMNSWGAARQFAGLSLPVRVFAGVPDVWPHVHKALVATGFETEAIPREAVYAGPLQGIPPPGNPPVAGMTLRRRVDRWGSYFAAILEEQEVGWCECVGDLTQGGLLPAMAGWAELSEMHAEASWRSRGIGSWLVQHAVDWLRLAGCTRIALNVSADDEARGAGRFYNRFGWRSITRLHRSWERQSGALPIVSDSE